MMQITIYSDGGSRGNPGPAAIGFAIYKNHDLLIQEGKCIGQATNNTAEYVALRNALRACMVYYKTLVKPVPFKIVCFLDSELVVKQLKGEYKVKQAHLSRLISEIKTIIQELKQLKLNSVSFNHIPRDKNKLADKLVNQALDKS